MKDALAEELAVFESHRQEWLAEHEGQVALVKDGEFSFHETDAAAYECGVDKYGNVDMLIKQVLREDLEDSHALRWHSLLGPAEGSPPPRGPAGRKEELVYRKLLNVAIMEAEDGLAEGGIPIGSALGDADGRILARGHNMRVQEGNPMVHAEIACMMDSGRERSFRGLILASTLMPCALCAGAAIQFGIGTVVVGENRTFAGERMLLESRGVRVVNLDDERCVRMMAAFVRDNPDLWGEDIGR